MCLNRKKQKLSRPVAFDPLKTSKLMGVTILLWGTSKNSLLSSACWEAQVVEHFKSNEGECLTSGLLQYARKRAYNATTSKVQFGRAQSQTRFLQITHSEEDTKGLTPPWGSQEEEPEKDASEIGKRGEWSPIFPFERPCKQQANSKRMTITNSKELLEHCNDPICAKRAGHRKTRSQEYSLSSLIDLVAAAASEIGNTKENIEHTECIKRSLIFELLIKLSACFHPLKAARYSVKEYMQYANTFSVEWSSDQFMKLPGDTKQWADTSKRFDGSFPLFITLPHRLTHGHALEYFWGLLFPF